MRNRPVGALIDFPPEGQAAVIFLDRQDLSVRWSEATRANGIRYHITVADEVSRYHIL